MNDNVETIESPYYICPNDCQNTFFFRDGTLDATELLTENGEHIEYKTGDFNPSEKVVRCRLCGQMAIKKIKKVSITIVIE
jgi:hypothetical protein